jgi:hypothetical protein
MLRLILSIVIGRNPNVLVWGFGAFGLFVMVQLLFR